MMAQTTTKLGPKQREMLKEACLTGAPFVRPQGHITTQFGERFYSDSTDVKNDVLKPLAEGTEHRDPLLENIGIGVFKIVRLPHTLKEEIKKEMKART